MSKVNLKTVATTLLETFENVTLLKTKEMVAATEKNIYKMEFLHYLARPIGENFENFPFGIEKKSEGSVNKVELINEQGKIIESIQSGELPEMSQQLNIQQKTFKFKQMKDEDVIVAIKLIVYNNLYNRDEELLLLLSKPYTGEEIKGLRNAHFDKARKQAFERNFQTIETIWK